MTRIQRRFSELRSRGGRAFIPYIAAGDPDLATTHRLVLALERAGADIVELGVPFSDPIADGPVIQRATERALKNGVTLQSVLALVAEIRKSSEIPIVLMSYFNPLLNHGLERLAAEAAAAGVDGILASDLTVEESDEYRRVIRGAGIDTIFLVAPTSSAERIERIARATSGFLYAVSRTGVTGARQELSPDLREFLKSLRARTDVPVAVGFGVSSPEHVQAIWKEADGAIVGSALVREIEAHLGRPDLAERVAEFAASLRLESKR